MLAENEEPLSHWSRVIESKYEKEFKRKCGDDYGK